MKKIASALALLTLLHTCVLAGPGPKRKNIAISPLINLPGSKITIPVNAPGMRMKKVGTTMTICGGVLLIAGTAMAASADSYSYNYSSSNGQVQESGDAKGAFGVFFIASGVGLTIPGIILWSKGSKKLKAYNETVSFKTNGTSAELVYQF